jgi:hypothetical protein
MYARRMRNQQAHTLPLLRSSQYVPDVGVFFVSHPTCRGPHDHSPTPSLSAAIEKLENTRTKKEQADWYHVKSVCSSRAARREDGKSTAGCALWLWIPGRTELRFASTLMTRADCVVADRRSKAVEAVSSFFQRTPTGTGWIEGSAGKLGRSTMGRPLIVRCLRNFRKCEIARL